MAHSKRVNLLYEEQRLAKSSFGLILIATYALCIGVWIYEYLQNGAVKTLGIIIVITILFTFPLLIVKLVTIVNTDFIEVSFMPFKIFKRRFPWASILSAKVIKYSAVKDYGGWGYRINGKTTVYSVKGNDGFEIQTNEGKWFVVGTQEPSKLQVILDDL